MAWLKDFVDKATEEYKQGMKLERERQRQFTEYQQEREQQKQRGFGYSQGSPSGWQQQGQFGQSSPYQPQSPQYGQPQSPQYPPPTSPYQPQPSYQPQSPNESSTPPMDRRTQYYADLAKFQAQAERAKVDAAKEQARLQAEFQAQQAQARAQAEQLQAQWLETERLAAQYKAEYEAQMRKAEEEMAKMKIDEEKQRSEFERLRAEEARGLKMGEEELIREQQRLFDEIQRARNTQKEEEEVRPPLPPRVSTEDRPALPKRPVSTASAGSGLTSNYESSRERRTSYLSAEIPPETSNYESSRERRTSYLSAEVPEDYVPPPPPPPPEVQGQEDTRRRPYHYSSPSASYQAPPRPSTQSSPQPQQHSPPRRQPQQSETSYSSPTPQSPPQQQVPRSAPPPPPPPPPPGPPPTNVAGGGFRQRQPSATTSPGQASQHQVPHSPPPPQTPGQEDSRRRPYAYSTPTAPYQAPPRTPTQKSPRPQPQQQSPPRQQPETSYPSPPPQSPPQQQVPPPPPPPPGPPPVRVGNGGWSQRKPSAATSPRQASQQQVRQSPPPTNLPQTPEDTRRRPYHYSSPTTSYQAPPRTSTQTSPQQQQPPPPPPPPPGPPPNLGRGGYRPRQSSGHASQQQVPPPMSPPQTPVSQGQEDSRRRPYAFSSPTTSQSHERKASYNTPPRAPTQTSSQQRSPPSIRAKPPRVRTPPPAQQHPCGAKPGAECSGALTAFPQHWFYHPAVPDFVICARCYIDHIYDSKFSNSFRKVFYDDGEKRRCRFSSRRVKDTLFPQAIESGSLDALVEFMKRRMSINDCREQNTVEGELWYRAADIPNGTICQACFEDGLITSSFAKYYTLQRDQGGAYCDLSVWFLKRKFMDYAKENKWGEFCRQFNERAQLPDCPKLNIVNANQYTWYKSISELEGLQACGACYHDYFYASEDEHKLQQVPGGNYNTRCALGQVNVVIPMHQALDDEDRSLFWNAVREMDKYPFCDSQGTKGGVWYTPVNDPQGWGICAACYEGIVKPVGGSRWFMKDTTTTQEGVYLCGFNLGHPRAIKALGAYSHARNWGDDKILLDWAAEWGSVEPCPRIKFVKNRRWWGWGMVAICEDCYASFAKGTALEPRFALTGQREPNKERMCDLFSPRMRGLYNEACQTGNLERFLSFAEQRHMIYTQTIMQCEQILNEHKMAAMQAQMLGVQGTVYKSMGWTQDATMGHRYTVGNSYAGYGHENEFVLQGYTYDRQAREKAAEVMSGGPMMRVQLLEARWKEVE
ncbi:integral membrane protein [Fusarium flagelliforme]|uniref:Integral membrane protein n=1 Tax=Fusarium flagelliforme TaxID=2675880 RepID=A0A395MKZ9_9HYPO|nr:integral membrane protein [Fusarium flagelliforme]